jgi:hypothetical protein
LDYTKWGGAEIYHAVKTAQKQAATGNRIGEQALDAQGLLKRQLSRLPDALGRINQVTGQE